MPLRRSDPELARTVGHRIRFLREESGITQEKLAWDCELSKGYLSRVEAGKHTPSLEAMQRLANRLACEVADFVSCLRSSPRLVEFEQARIRQRRVQ